MAQEDKLFANYSRRRELLPYRWNITLLIDLQSWSQNSDSNFPTNEVSQTTCLPNFKLKFLDVVIMRKIPPHGLDEFDPYTNPVFQPFGKEEDYYSGSDSSLASPRN